MKRRSTYRPLIALTIFAILVISSNLFGQLYRSTLYKVFVESRNTIKVKFSYSPFIVVTGIPVRFFDRSGGNPSAWTWDFGDGTQSNDQNPSHIYENAGVYAISFTVTLNGSPINTIKKVRVYGSKINSSNKDNSNDSVRADFSYNPPNPTPGTQVQFADKSLGNITSWSWKFGDGGTSTQKNPAHSYSLVGSYIVTLAASDGTTSNSMTQTIKVADAIIVDFYFSPDAPAVNQAVQFIDKTYGTPTSWSWDFGDGAKSSAKNPSHSYSQVGTYSVKLTVSDGKYSFTKNKSLTVVNSSSKVITASSYALADVQAAIARANVGDTVIVPNGTARWTSTLIIEKGVILKAATPGGVKIINDTAVNSPTGYGDPSNFVIAYVPSDATTGQPFRLSGFVIDGGSQRWTFQANTFDHKTLAINQFRIDHCTFQHGYDNDGLVFYGEIYGVIDNCTIHGVNREFSHNETTWSNFNFAYGTANNRYYEDNTIYQYDGSAAPEGGCGGRYCYRYNTFHHVACTTGANPWFDMHGNMGTGGNLSTMGAEIYGNVIYTGNMSLTFFDQRGGRLIAFNNIAYDVAGVNGAKAREENNDNLNPPATSPDGQPQHVFDSYYWNNIANGSVIHDSQYYISGTVDYGGDVGIVPRYDVHCFKHVESFDGSSGVGVGPLSKRPAYCATEGVAWWATDENKLYRWHNGSWELYYTPYTYPHPLRTTMGD